MQTSENSPFALSPIFPLIIGRGKSLVPEVVGASNKLTAFGRFEDGSRDNPVAVRGLFPIRRVVGIVSGSCIGLGGLSQVKSGSTTGPGSPSKFSAGPVGGVTSGEVHD